MGRFVARRLLVLIPVLFGVTVLVFMLIHLTPGDPVKVIMGTDYTPEGAEILRHQLGLDGSVLSQYGTWIGNVLQGDLGTSLFSQEAVGTLIAQRLPLTLELAAGGLLVGLLFGLPLGVVAASRPGSGWDRGGRIAALVGVSLPVYWLGLILIQLFAVRLGWLPSGGGPADEGISALVLPSIALGIGFAAIVARTTRAAVLECLGQEYVDTARAKGLSPRRVLLVHAVRNALVPIVTVVGLQFGVLLGGAVLTETVFSLPGLGRLLIDSITQRDFPVMQGCVLVIALGFVLVNLLTDIVYGYLDPRIRMR